MVWRLGVLALVVVALCSRVGGEQLAATAITLLPFADKGSNDADSWIVPNQRANHGPMGAYLSVMLKACGHVDGLNVTRWASSQREAEYGLVFKQRGDIVFPVARQWALSDVSSEANEAGDVFVPTITSPGTTIIVVNDYSPTTTSRALFSSDIVVILLAMCCLSVMAGVAIWLLERHHRKSNFPVDFTNGAGIGMWWALVSLTTVGYGDRVPKTKLGRVFGSVWLIVGVMLLALLQGIVIQRLTSDDTDLLIRQLRTTADELPGLVVGVVNGSVEEWRMRSRGSSVKAYANTRAALKALLDDRDPLNAVAIDTIASAVAVQLVSGTGNRLRTSGSIEDTVTYGYLLSQRVANLPAGGEAVGMNLTLAACLNLLSSTGPEQFDLSSFFRPYVELAFTANLDLNDQREQDAAARSSERLTAIILPLLTVLVVAAGLVFEFIYDRPRRQQQYRAQGSAGSSSSGGGAGSRHRRQLDPRYHKIGLSDFEEPAAGSSERAEGTITSARQSPVTSPRGSTSDILGDISLGTLVEHDDEDDGALAAGATAAASSGSHSSSINPWTDNSLSRGTFRRGDPFEHSGDSDNNNDDDDDDEMALWGGN